jgi:hypothetical protein
MAILHFGNMYSWVVDIPYLVVKFEIEVPNSINFEGKGAYDTC